MPIPKLLNKSGKCFNDLDINRLTPVEALLKLNEIKGLLQ